MEIKIVDISQIDELVEIHKSAFKGFFLTELGDEFLRTYYRSLVMSDSGVIVGAIQDGRLVGFMAATKYSSGFNSSLIKNNLFTYAVIGVKLLFTRPKALVRLFKNFSKSPVGIEDRGDYSEMLSMGVFDEFQGMGIGRMLMTGTENYLSNRGATRVSLTTDYYDNDHALRLDEQMDYEVLYDFVA